MTKTKDIKLDIATATSRNSRSWKNVKMTWGDLVDKLANARIADITFKRYKAIDKESKADLKDVGGYFPGYLRGGKRGKSNVVHKQIIILDLDYSPENVFEQVQDAFPDTAFILHSTMSHGPGNPRYRLAFPLDEPAAPDEWVAAARRVAGDIDIEWFDNTTFDINRFNHWSAVCSDVDYVFEEQEGKPLSLEALLDSYTDWTDVSEWPSIKEVHHVPAGLVEGQQDPLKKKGLIGAFCRTYTIQEAIDKFLPEAYEPGDDGRYSYTQGTTKNGVVIYEDKFLYSHHNTDPVSELLVNVYDLVRIHKFGKLDAPGSRKRSTEAIDELIGDDVETKKTVAKDLLQDSAKDFAKFRGDKPEVTDERSERRERRKRRRDREQSDADLEKRIEWMSELATDKNGRYLATAANLDSIFRNDDVLKGAFAFNDFDKVWHVRKNMPWKKLDEDSRTYGDLDDSGVRGYIENVYQISHPGKVKDALTIVADENHFHPVCEYLNSLSWDGVPRVETLLTDFLGVEDSVYTRAVSRMTLAGAANRVFCPGCKFDTMLVLAGEQGEGKSEFLRRLARGWFSETLTTTRGKDAFEQIQGVWILEIPEIDTLQGADLKAMKGFLTKESDYYRGAYGHHASHKKRQLIFTGSCNKRRFLTDASGNRRYVPVTTDPKKATLSIYDDMTPEFVSQVWAEVMTFYQTEKLYLTGEAKAESLRMQADHFDYDDRVGIIEDYLNTKLPENWGKYNLNERIMFLESGAGTGTETRTKVCIAEIWCECLGKDKRDMSRYNTRDLNEILRTIEGWEASSSTSNFPMYGKQKYFVRKRDRVSRRRGRSDD